jgi:hypothetical protein
MPYIVIDHPLQMISPEEIEVRAQQVAAQIESLLNDELNVGL